MERQPVDAITAINRFAGSDPKRVALRHGADELTYEALRSRSDALAKTLREQGARGGVVGYWLGRDLDWATAVIAILKAGSTYLPLDPWLPASRTSLMIEQSRCALLMGRDRPALLSLFQESSKAAPQFVAIEAALRRGQTSSVVPSPNVDGLAYILFTSGSTGQPKGAMIERAGLNNHLAAKIDALSLTRTDCVAQTASHCFDISLWQLLSGNCVGASTSIIDDATLRSPSSLLQAIQRCGATVVQFVPSMLAVFVEYLQSLAAAERAMDGLRIISTVGEPLTPGLARAWLALYPRVSILNHYGPTECADGVTHHLVAVPPALAEPYVPIGRPIQNVEVYVADGPRLCNVGEVGEICVSGVGVAAGYVNDHVRTKDAFGPNPFSSDLAFRRLYRTGDLGRIRSDGLLECLGRRDRQVKIRGHRIELGEIEARLSAHPLVHGAVAVASVCTGVKLTARDIARAEAQAESRRLFAYVTAPAELAESDLQKFLAEALPSYMLPERIIRVSSIPLTRNGKVDFAALPDPGSVRPLLSTPFEEPQSDLEVRLRQIWSGILRIENIGVNDQFISLGGDSLRAMLILGQLQTLLGVKADFRLVLNGTIRSLAASIEARTERNPCTALTCRKLNRSPLTRLQEHLWFLAQLDPSARNYIIQGGLRIKGNIDLARFNRAWTEVIHSHQALSARFIDEDGPVQCFDAPPCTNLESIDASHLTSSEDEELIAQFRRTELKDNFDLGQGRLFRARMVRFGPDNHLILITAHEIILDAWSISVLLRDLQQRYLDAAAPRPENRASLSGYAAWEKQHVSPEALENQRHYWRRQIGDDPPVLSLGRARPQTNSYRGGSHPVLLGGDLSGRVREFARQKSCTTSTTLLACFQLLLRMYSGQDDIVVGMPHAVRDQPGSADIIGFFLNMLPIRAAIDAGQSFAAHARRIQSLVSDAIANSAYPFGWMVRDTRLCREPGRSPIFQVMFNMYSEAAEPLGRDELALTFRGDEIALQLAYAEDIISSDLAVRMANNLRCLIAACVDKALAPIEELSCLSASDLTILDSLDGSIQQYESECPLAEASEQISVSNHGKVAYFGEFGEVTFDQLRARVAAIRSLLREMKVGAGDLVAMLIDRSPDVVAVMLAARGLDAVVVPIAPDYPRDRIQHILGDSEAKLLVHVIATEPEFDLPSICLSTLERCSRTANNFAPSERLVDRRIANLIYTSSSTGRAKGVLIPEAAILNRLNWMWRRFPFDATDIMIVQKSACLVASAWEYFGGLLRGVPTLILTQEQVLDPDLLLCSLAKHRVTRFFASLPLLSGLIGSQERQPQRTALRLVTSSTAFRLVDSVPLTTSGKIDRARLSSVPYREIEASPSAEPRTRNERVLARIWEDLLDAKGVGIDSSFFDIGGDTLLSVRCVTLARKAGLNLTVNQLYRTPTIRELAAEEAEAAPHNVASADGLLPVLPVISFWNSLLGFDERFNMGDLFFLRGGILNIKILDRALVHVIERHEGLRLRVARTQDGLRLGIGPCSAERIVEEIDLVRMTGADQRRTIESVWARRQHMFRFDGHTPLVHVAAFRTSESGDYYLLVLMHHFVADGMGYRLFLEALEGAYNALAAGHDVNGPETVQRLSPWLKRLEHYANSEAPDELKHWEGIDYDQFNLRVSDASSGGTSVAKESARELHDASLKGRREDANGRSIRVDQAKYHLEVDGEATASLLRIGAKSAHCQDFDVFLAALSGACGALFGNYSLLIDSLTSTRGRLFDDFDSSQIIGLISELVPLPLHVTGREARSDRARSIYRQRNALPRGGIGFRALKFLNRDPAVRCRLDRLPLPRIGVNYRASLQRHFACRFLDTEPYPLWIGEYMHQAAAIYLSFSNRISIRRLLQQELSHTIDELAVLRSVNHG
ncbi:non-ribosomal peptide synthetase [Bradyrhizobium sp. 179]|uniref:non-ribosomal peptide synthetase n=1 Tax=Bradyrhizobium sp. 179 TaxID=2782648 RepID=UPI001FFA539F|nr:non-ribosomal peptide synthetase [Bradyrhizobium sp. 179]